jgi:hypothetical protein
MQKLLNSLEFTCREALACYPGMICQMMLACLRTAGYTKVVFATFTPNLGLTWALSNFLRSKP